MPQGIFLLSGFSWLRSSRTPSPREAPRGVAAQVSKALVCRRAWWVTGNLEKSCPVLVLRKASRVKPHGSVLGPRVLAYSAKQFNANWNPQFLKNIA